MKTRPYYEKDNTTIYNDIVVISLFDGLSGGRIALERIPHLNVLRYYSSEIDKYAIHIADKNYPQDTPYRLGDVKDIDGYSLLLKIRKEFRGAKILLIGGSPCQGFSMAGKLKGASTKSGQDVVTLKQYLDLKERGFEFEGQSYLFWEYVRIMRELKPDYFMLENVRVTKKWLPMFNKAMGVEPTRINSSLVSAQNRVRYYWYNFENIPQPEDKGILLKDILDYSVKDIQRRPCELRDFNKNSICHHIANATDIKGNESIKRVYSISGKSPTVTTCQGGHREPKVLCSPLDGNNAKYRKLTPLECERLQTLPDNYTKGVSNTQRYKMIGNGWTIDIVTHILSYIGD